MASNPIARSSSLERFGRYTMIRQLGRGGIGSVHLAKKDGATELCVLKQLHVEHEGNENVLRRFRREAQLSSYLDHPGIARVLDAGNEGGEFFIAFELITGQTLSSTLGRLDDLDRWITPSMALRIALDALDALAYAHAATDPEGKPLELVHRDLSPNNLMINYAGAVKIIDFGLAAAKLDDFKTRAGQMIGTLRYMSPEQATMRPADRRSDLYTIAVVLWEMLAAKRLVAKGTMKDMLAAIAVQRARPLVDLEPSLPRGLSDVLARALEKDPARRFQTAEELADALRGVRSVEIAEKRELADVLDKHFAKEKSEARALVARGEQLAAADLLAESALPPTAFYDGSGNSSEWSQAEAERDAYGDSVSDAPDSIPESLLDSLPELDERTLEPVPRTIPPMLAAEPREDTAMPTEILGAAVDQTAVLPEITAPQVVAVVSAGGAAGMMVPRRRSPAVPRTLLFLLAPLAIAIGMVAYALWEREQAVPATLIDPVPIPIPIPVPVTKPAPAVTARKPEPSELEQLAEPPPESEPEPEPEVEPEPPPQRREKPRRVDSEEPKKPAAPKRPYPELDAMLARLRESPSDGALLLKLHRAIKAEATKLPEAEAKPIIVDIDAGLRGGDAEAIAKGLEKLSRR